MESFSSCVEPMLAAGKINWTGEIRKLSEPWVLFGFFAQSVFAMRFMVQWIASERRGQSYVPIIFWHLSLLGTALLCAYAIHRRDPVFILGQSLNAVIYVRNLMLIRHPKTAPAMADSRLPVVAPDKADSKTRLIKLQK